MSPCPFCRQGCPDLLLSVPPVCLLGLGGWGRKRGRRWDFRDGQLAVGPKLRRSVVALGAVGATRGF